MQTHLTPSYHSSTTCCWPPAYWTHWRRHATLSETQLLKSVLGYLALDSELRTLLKQVLWSVCQVCCNSSAVKRTSVEQQLYVRKVLLLCVASLDHSEIQELRHEMLQCMLGGVQCRLDSNIERIRRMGMAMDEEIRELKSLMESPSVEDGVQHQPDTSTRLRLRWAELCWILFGPCASTLTRWCGGALCLRFVLCF